MFIQVIDRNPKISTHPFCSLATVKTKAFLSSIQTSNCLYNSPS